MPGLQVEEGWVQCDQCEGWVHQICGLFNKGRNDQTRGFLCPFCLRDGEPAPSASGCLAVGLSGCAEPCARHQHCLCRGVLRGQGSAAS
jgi:hypothetical protein